MDASIVCSGKGLEINQKSHDKNCREMPQIVTLVISNGGYFYAFFHCSAGCYNIYRFSTLVKAVGQYSLPLFYFSTATCFVI